jgi:Uma2 family endonuclease
MTETLIPPKNALTIADLAERLGPMPPGRIRFDPAPGTAHERDVVEIYNREKRLCELADGVLVEKTVGTFESWVAIQIAYLFERFLEDNDLGIVLGADGMMRLCPGLVRIPDVSFVAWKQLPGRRVPRVSMLKLAPDLAVEVLSPSNTAEEMDRKLHDYFSAGVRLVWYVDPAARTVRVFTSVKSSSLLREGDELTGGTVLPGFAVPVARLFARGKR